MSEIIYYSLNDFNTFTYNSRYQLDSSVFTIISDLNSKLGIRHDIPKQLVEPEYKSKNRNTEESWEQLRTFKATVVEKKTEGIEKTINEIRVFLNKMSKKNYDVIRDNMIQSIDNIYNTDESIESIRKVANYIFEIASTNKFFSEIYAELYKELTQRYVVFQNILSEFISTFTDTLKDIQYVDQNIDYDKFCANNKINDSRKATSVFIVNLVKNGVLEEIVLLSAVSKMMGLVLEYIDLPDKICQVEEITENIFLIITESLSILKNAEGTHILENVGVISKMKPKEKTSLSSRAVFKYMDILDKLSK
jgi:hypothetical protein